MSLASLFNTEPNTPVNKEVVRQEMAARLAFRASLYSYFKKWG